MFKLGQFLETPDKDLINLQSVSNIVFDPDWTDRQGNHKPKIIFNFDYQVSLPGSDKKIADYKYIIFGDKKDYDQYVFILNQLVNEQPNGKNWLAPMINGKVNKIINPDKISFVTSDDSNLRIILNLRTPVSFHNNYKRMTSDFVYLNHNNWDEYQNNLGYITGNLKLRGM